MLWPVSGASLSLWAICHAGFDAVVVLCTLEKIWNWFLPGTIDVFRGGFACLAQKPNRPFISCIQVKEADQAVRKSCERWWRLLWEVSAVWFASPIKPDQVGHARFVCVPSSDEPHPPTRCVLFLDRLFLLINYRFGFWRASHYCFSNGSETQAPRVRATLSFIRGAAATPFQLFCLCTCVTFCQLNVIRAKCHLLSVHRLQRCELMRLLQSHWGKTRLYFEVIQLEVKIL